MKKAIHIMTSDELKLFWNQFERSYRNRMEDNLLPIHTTMCNLLKLKDNIQSSNKINILEMAIGSGEGIKNIIHKCISNNINNKEIEIFATDISDSMINASYDKIKNIDKISISLNNQEDSKQENIRVSLIEADNEDLPFEDNKMDIIISNLSLHIVNSPERMLKETLRLLKPGGYAAFSVWGKPELSLAFTVIPNIFKKHGIELPQSRSNFHLADVSKIKELLISNGFNKFNYSNIFVPFNFFKGEEFEFMFESPMYEKIMETINQDTKQTIKKEVYDEIDKVLGNNQLVGTDSLVILIKKD